MTDREAHERDQAAGDADGEEREGLGERARAPPVAEGPPAVAHPIREDGGSGGDALGDEDRRGDRAVVKNRDTQHVEQHDVDDESEAAHDGETQEVSRQRSDASVRHGEVPGRDGSAAAWTALPRW